MAQGSASEIERRQLIAASGDDLHIVDPHIAVAREHVDMGLRFPVGTGLAAVGIAEGQMNTGNFFVLQQDADHVGEGEVGAERQLPYPVAVGVTVAVLPEFLLQLLARAVRGFQAAA